MLTKPAMAHSSSRSPPSSTMVSSEPPLISTLLSRSSVTSSMFTKNDD